jgi:hypothetical protein
MKECPKCTRVYSDNSLRFCLDDGSALISTAAAQPTMRIPPPVKTALRTEVLPGSRPTAPPNNRSIVPWIIAGAAIVVAGIVVVVSLGILMYAKKPTPTNTGSNTNGKAPGWLPTPAPTVVNLAGTRWNDTYENIASKSYYFSPDGTINGSSSSTWKQTGRTVILEFNDHYARYEGTINSTNTVIDYKAKNKVNFEWSATIVRAP